MKKLTGLFLFAFSFTILKAQVISTIAGDSIASYNGDGIAATSAELNNPTCVTTDAAGNIYIADEINNRIRKITASSGIITTIAGTGTFGYSGDSGPATSAELSYPSGLAIDASGNVFIADFDNARIRKITASTGVITTVAGNGTWGYNGDGIAATSAELYGPYCVALDTAGNIYIADYQNNRIRKVTQSTGIITTVAGNGTGGYTGDGSQATSAELYRSYGVALDVNGNIYIADTYNNRIRKVTASTGIITTVAGDSLQGYNGDGIAATSAELFYPGSITLDDENIYISDDDNNRIRKIVMSSGIITTVAGSGKAGYNGDGITANAAELNYPAGVALDEGNILIADFSNNRIREVNLFTGINETVSSKELVAYPVPCRGQLTLSLGGNGYIGLYLYNMSGQQICTWPINPTAQGVILHCDLSNVSEGEYIMQILTQKEIISKKIEIVK
ncbi:MAG: hypothetical protein ACLQQ4_18590 [Bacteroidia bacterium]